MLSRTWLGATLVLAPLALPAVLAPGVSAGRPAPGWHDAPALLRVFTPLHAPAGAYAAYTTDATIEKALQQVKGDPTLSSWPGAWAVETVGPFDAFGQAGGYNRWALARLYGGTPARVARGPRIEGGRVTESWTLISPFPDAQIEHLNPGTLLIVLRLR